MSVALLTAVIDGDDERAALLGGVFTNREAALSLSLWSFYALASYDYNDNGGGLEKFVFDVCVLATVLLVVVVVVVVMLRVSRPGIESNGNEESNYYDYDEGDNNNTYGD